MAGGNAPASGSPAAPVQDRHPLVEQPAALFSRTVTASPWQWHLLYTPAHPTLDWMIDAFYSFSQFAQNLIFKSHSLKSPERPRTNPWQQGIGWDWEKGIPRMGKSNGKTTLMPKPTLCPESCCCLMSCDKFGNDKTHHDEKCSTPRVSWIIDIFSPISLFVFWHFFLAARFSCHNWVLHCPQLKWLCLKKKMISAGYLNHPHTHMHVSGTAVKLKMKI